MAADVNVKEACTHFDDVSYFLSVQAAISISIINFKRPFQFVFEFSTKNKMHSGNELHEVQFTVLRENQRSDTSVK